MENHLSQNIIFLRNKHGLTQSLLADMLGIRGKTSIVSYEIGGCVPKIENLIKLKSIFGVSIDDLICKDLSK